MTETPPLHTMRADLSSHVFPAGLCEALNDYNYLRAFYRDYHRAEYAFHDKGIRRALVLSDAAARLSNGMQKLTAKGILQISARLWDDQDYIKKHIGYFTDLMGLFYFNGGPDGEALIAAILRRAWLKGSYPANKGVRA